MELRCVWPLVASISLFSTFCGSWAKLPWRRSSPWEIFLNRDDVVRVMWRLGIDRSIYIYASPTRQCHEAKKKQQPVGSGCTNMILTAIRNGLEVDTKNWCCQFLFKKNMFKCTLLYLVWVRMGVHGRRTVSGHQEYHNKDLISSRMFITIRSSRCVVQFQFLDSVLFFWETNQFHMPFPRRIAIYIATQIQGSLQTGLITGWEAWYMNETSNFLATTVIWCNSM